jgi:hypothetical protein
LKEKYREYGIFYVIQQEQSDIWGAIKESFPYSEDVNIFAMPDTLFDKTAFRRQLESRPLVPFNLGVFSTQQPERFGVLVNGKVINKTPLPTASYSAWGAMIWNKAVIESWLQNDPGDYTNAINQAIENFGYDAFDLNYYYDFSTWSDYKRWLAESSGPFSDDPGVEKPAASAAQI